MCVCVCVCVCERERERAGRRWPRHPNKDPILWGGGGGGRGVSEREGERGRGREGPIYGVERGRERGEKGGRVGKGGRKTTKGKGVKDSGTVDFLLIGF